MSEPTRFLTTDVPGIGGSIKQRPEDFIVEERPLYEPCGEGEHLYLFIEKHGIGSDDLVKTVASHFGVARSAVGVAGRKDADAVTRQVVSVHLPGRSEDEFGMLPDDRLRALWVDRHTNKLRMGHLAGNSFNIRIRDVGMQDVLAAQRVLRVLERTGVPNAFGPQRFGRKGTNAARGAAMLRSGSVRGNPGTVRMLLNAAQSAVFNTVLDERLAEGSLNELRAGDLAWVHASGAVFAVDPPADADLAERLETLEISPSGPMWGASMSRASGTTADAELAALRRLDLEPEHFASPALRRFAAGARRPLRVPLTAWDIEGGIDEHGGYVRVVFDLPAGAYATSVLREITKVPQSPEGRVQTDE